MDNRSLKGTVIAVCCNPEPGLPKPVVEVTERRNPCYQLNGIDPRLLKAVVKKMPERIIFKAGMMTRILKSGRVRAGDLVEVLSPANPGYSGNVTK